MIAKCSPKYFKKVRISPAAAMKMVSSTCDGLDDGDDDNDDDDDDDDDDDMNNDDGATRHT